MVIVPHHVYLALSDLEQAMEEEKERAKIKGMDDTLTSGNLETAVIAANQKDSDFRKMFGVSNWNEEPFSTTEENGELVFTLPPALLSTCPIS